MGLGESEPMPRVAGQRGLCRVGTPDKALDLARQWIGLRCGVQLERALDRQPLSPVSASSDHHTAKEAML